MIDTILRVYIYMGLAGGFTFFIIVFAAAIEKFVNKYHIGWKKIDLTDEEKAVLKKASTTTYGKFDKALKAMAAARGEEWNIYSYHKIDETLHIK